MDYLDPDKKRQHTRRLFIGYGLMAVLIGLGTILLVLFAYGFSFDRSTGSIIQNGLVFVDTNPVEANVYVNGELRGRGDQRLVLPDDEYSIEVQEPGYRSWYKDLSLAGGSLIRLSYPFLFPETIETSTYRRFSQEPNLLSTSPDRRWLLLQESEDITSFVLYDLEQGINLPTFFSLPTGVVQQGASGSELSIVEWSNDNEHVIVKHSHDDGAEYILVNRLDASLSQNLTDRFSDYTFQDISLIDKQYDQYHLFDRQTGELVQAELQSNNAELVLEDVITYRSHGEDALLYVRELPRIDEGADSNDVAQAPETVGVFMERDDSVYQIDSLPKAPATDYLLDLARFSGSWYVAVGYAQERRVLIYQDPIELLEQNEVTSLSPVATLHTDTDPHHVSFSTNARNIALQASEEYAVYDAEREEIHNFRVAEEGTELPRGYWMDGHRLTTIQDDRLFVADFDGENQQEISHCVSGYRSLFDTDYEYAYCIAPSDEDGQFGSLQRLSLRVEDEE